jgi:hypothetical protein
MTSLDARVLGFIVRFRAKHYGNSPSLMEITEGLGYRYMNVVQVPVRRLIRSGHLRKVGKRAFLVPSSTVESQK